MRPFLAFLLALMLVPFAGADECIPTTSDPEISAGGFYVDNDLCQLPPDGSTDAGDLAEWWFGGSGGSYPDGSGACLFSIWTYQESNGIDGLQRWDEVHDDTCRGTIDGDSLAFY